jgi:hypothetical protein
LLRARLDHEVTGLHIQGCGISAKTSKGGRAKVRKRQALGPSLPSFCAAGIEHC